MERLAIIDGIRTPFCKMGTVFNNLDAVELGRIAAREVIERSAIDVKAIDEVIIGNVGQPARAANISRVIALLSGVPKTTPAYTVHRNCASGLEAVVQAAMKLTCGEGECYLVGGTESMSYIHIQLKKSVQDRLMALSKAKTPGAQLSALAQFYGPYLNFQKSLDIGLKLGLTDPVCGLNMGETAEVLAKEFGITREEQDAFSLRSHEKANAAVEILKEEIVPVVLPPAYKKTVFADNGPRENQTIEALAKLKPFFERRTGTITAGNSSQVTDGAVALIVTTEKKAKALGIKPLGYLCAFAFAGVEPERMGIGPAHAIPKVLKKAGKSLSDVQAIEINEAFAAQVLACLRALESKKFAEKFGYEGYTGAIDPAILNVNGGAVALGHPVGATGARLILTMLKHLKRQDLHCGLVSLCIGGGQGAAVLLER